MPANKVLSFLEGRWQNYQSNSTNSLTSITYPSISNAGKEFKKYNIESFRQPDAIETYTTDNGDTYVITANEGKQLEYECSLSACPPGGGEFVEFEKGDEFPEGLFRIFGQSNLSIYLSIYLS